MERTWIVGCDASHCRFFLKRQASHEWVKFEEFEYAEGREKGVEIASDRPGRRFDVGPNHRSGVGPQTDPRVYEDIRFAHTISKTMTTTTLRKPVDRCAWGSSS